MYSVSHGFTCTCMVGYHPIKALDYHHRITECLTDANLGVRARVKALLRRWMCHHGSLFAHRWPVMQPVAPQAPSCIRFPKTIMSGQPTGSYAGEVQLPRSFLSYWADAGRLGVRSDWSGFHTHLCTIPWAQSAVSKVNCSRLRKHVMRLG
jgi:hypothetical protein